MTDEQDLVHFLKQDAELIKLLHAVANLDLPDCWIWCGIYSFKSLGPPSRIRNID